MGPLRIARSTAAALFFFSVLATAAPGKKLPVTVGEVEITAPVPATVRPLLQRALEEELKLQDFGRARFAKRYVLSASVLKLENALNGRTVTSTCVVSVVLRNQDQILVAMIRGQASAEGARAKTAEAQTEALRGAVRSAIGRVPKALRATEARL